MLDVVKQHVDDCVKDGNRERITLENAYLETTCFGLSVLTSDDSLLVVVEAGYECYQFTWGMVVRQCKLNQLVVDTNALAKSSQAMVRDLWCLLASCKMDESFSWCSSQPAIRL